MEITPTSTLEEDMALATHIKRRDGGSPSMPPVGGVIQGEAAAADLERLRKLRRAYQETPNARQRAAYKAAQDEVMASYGSVQDFARALGIPVRQVERAVPPNQGQRAKRPPSQVVSLDDDPNDVGRPSRLTQADMDIEPPQSNDTTIPEITNPVEDEILAAVGATDVASLGAYEANKILMESLKSYSDDNNKVPPDARTLAKELVTKTPTLGEIYFNNMFPNLNLADREALSEELDTAHIDTANKAIEHHTMMEFFSGVADDASEFVSDLASDVANFKGIGPKPKGPSTTLTGDPYDTQLPAAVVDIMAMADFEDGALVDATVRSPSHIRIKQMVLQQTIEIGAFVGIFPGGSKTEDALVDTTTKTVRNFIEWILPVSYEDSMDTDYGLFISEMWDNQTISPQFIESMESKYGDDWWKRLTAYGVKEIGVDAGILALLAANPLTRKRFFKQTGDKLLPRIKKVFMRAAAVGIGGAGVEVQLHSMIDEDANFAREASIRFTAELGGELLFKMLGMGFRGLHGTWRTLVESTEKYAERNGLRVANVNTWRDRLLPGRYRSPMSAIVVKASVQGEIKALREMQNKLGDAFKDDEAAAEIVKNIEQLTGMKFEDAEAFLAVADGIFHIDMKAMLRPEARPKIEALNAINDLIDRLRVVWKKRPVKTATSQKRRDDQMQTLQANKVALEKEIQGFRYYTSGSELGDLVLSGKAFGFRLIGEMASRQGKVLNTFFTYFDDKAMSMWGELPQEGGTMLKFINPFELSKRLKRVLRWQEGEDLVGAAAKDSFDSVNRSNKLAAMFNKMSENALRGLKSRERNAVLTLLEKGAEDGTVYFEKDILRMLGKDGTPRVTDAYYAIRKAMDIGHFVLDRATTREMTEKGIKQWGNIPVNVTRLAEVGKGDKILTAEMVEKGMVRIREVATNSSNKQVDRIVHKSELKELKSVLGAISGYIPRIYKNARYHVTVIDATAGTITRTHAFGTRREALEHAKETDGALEANQVAIYNKWDSSTNMGQFGVLGNTKKLIDIADDTTMANIKKALNGSGLDAGQLKVVLDMFDGSNLRRAFTGQRADNALLGAGNKPAPVFDTSSAISEYFAGVARKSGSGDWRDYALSMIW